jgi:hypothetical protein
MNVVGQEAKRGFIWVMMRCREGGYIKVEISGRLGWGKEN